jgi:colanic acid biosynthesis glycosyl transferase WcaI
MYASADISLVCLRSDIGSESVPSKAYTILASGRPLLASVAANAETRLLIDEADCGVWVSAENPTQLAEAICDLYQNPAQRAQFGANGRRYVEQHHTPDAIARQYIVLFDQIT